MHRQNPGLQKQLLKVFGIFADSPGFEHLEIMEQNCNKSDKIFLQIFIAWISNSPPSFCPRAWPEDAYEPALKLQIENQQMCQLQKLRFTSKGLGDNAIISPYQALVVDPFLTRPWRHESGHRPLENHRNIKGQS